ncbi:MAG: hypothetical protein J7K48_09260 [Thermococcus sp.]|nr:hypothetical protein [Thermococcus sp.]
MSLTYFKPPRGPSIKELSRELGINDERVRREFRWWCRKHGFDPMNFLRPNDGGFRLRYHLPQEFVEHMRKLVKNERHLYVVNGKIVEEG